LFFLEKLTVEGRGLMIKHPSDALMPHLMTFPVIKSFEAFPRVVAYLFKL
jgi:hypothetical protein